ncbi:MAG: hypothetical protein QOJ32_1593 [Frankiaceae bacterium]|jgi:EmrB/QacA subfamily drug resistance transporter|nr:hypothetical protein [Frankiaceae bacterium]MDQ1634784.1 hypothetical protein [Frankiaceae bacterium]MDQ1671775.1 hypothetical protein [Frankiaceae bacterium]
MTRQHNKWWALGAVSLGTFITMLDITVVNVALPTIEQDLHTSVNQLEWVVDAYVLTFAVLMLAAGKLADMLGRRLVFMIGLAVFGISSLAAGLASTGDTLVVMRGIQGVGAALITPAALSIIVSSFPRSQRGVAIGINGAVIGLSTAIGPLIGGYLTERFGWGWIFIVNVPVVVVALITAPLLIPESRDRSGDRSLDLAGLLTGGIGLFGLVYALIQGNHLGWSSPLILAAFAAAVFGLLGFILSQARRRRPMVPLHLFSRGSFSGANVIALLLSFAMFGLFFFASLYLQNVLGYSAIKAGAAFLPMTVVIMLVAPVAGVAVERGATRPLMVIGMSLMALSLVLFSRLGISSQLWEVLIPMLLGGIAMALALTPLVDVAMAAVPEDLEGVGAGILNTSRQVGGALGLAAMGAIVTSGVTSSVALGTTRQAAFVHGFHNALILAAAVSLLGAVAGLWMRPERPEEESSAGRVAQPAENFEPILASAEVH